MEVRWIDNTNEGVEHYWLVDAEAPTREYDPSVPPGVCGIVGTGSFHAAADEFYLVEQEK